MEQGDEYGQGLLYAYVKIATMKPFIFFLQLIDANKINFKISRLQCIKHSTKHTASPLPV